MLLVAVGLLGQLVLGRSNDRVASLGSAPGASDRLRAAPEDVLNLRNLLAENVGDDFYKVWTEVPQRENLEAIDRHASSAVAPSKPDGRGSVGFTPPPEDHGTSRPSGTPPTALGWCWRAHPPLPKDATADEVLPIRAQSGGPRATSRRSTADLADGTRAEVEELIARNASSFASSRALFIGVQALHSCSRCC